tara:strand:- start:796 stop:1227 length:432 start_codon:yes stop_codon:yes gene_type:complete
MNNTERALMNKFADKYKLDCKEAKSDVSPWDFTYHWDDRKFYCEMKKRNFSLEFAKERYAEGILLEMHKYERILRRSKNEKGSQGLYINFFDCGSVLVFNLNKLRIDKWLWKTLPETTEFGRSNYVYKYITFVDYSKGKVLYI